MSDELLESIKKAEAGDAEEQYYLGKMYDLIGLDATQNDERAFEWYVKAADQGHVLAQESLGRVYEFGRLGVTQNDKKAFEWYEKAAKQGHASAQDHLGWMYEKGLGVTQDDERAFEWHEKAANQGDASAQDHLGWMYENGLGITQDDEKAFEWYEKSANQGYVPAQIYLGAAYEFGRLGVTQDYKEAIEWYEKLAAQGLNSFENRLSILKLGDLIELKRLDKGRLEQSVKDLYKSSKTIISALEVDLTKNKEFEGKVAKYSSVDVATRFLSKDVNKETNHKYVASAIRLNHVNNMNDKHEGAMLAKFLDLEINPTNEETLSFLSSFSFNHEDLSMFRMYAKNQGIEAAGVSVIFDQQLFSSSYNFSVAYLAEKITNNNSLKAEITKTNTESSNKTIDKQILYRCAYLNPESGFISLAKRDRYSFFLECKNYNSEEIIHEFFGESPNAESLSVIYKDNGKQEYDVNTVIEYYKGKDLNDEKIKKYELLNKIYQYYLEDVLEEDKKSQEIMSNLLKIKDATQEVKRQLSDENFSKLNIYKLMNYMGLLFKDAAFKDENECRIFYFANDYSHVMLDKNYNNIYVCYPDDFFIKNKVAITCIYPGPKCSAKDIKVLQYLKDTNQRDKTKIKMQSDLPFQ